ncbi:MULTISPECIES: bifunctional N-acetylglucosamine-1-phosphate uridyltransferase/glucosamine-1-phosphate acetyltransferase [unclassified Streptomyces]|uniref:bifunctional UDP-N-acetylglucosamine diphosphorylase/glucosamine-1-phosphate N-acetyltransferase GlmU n=1 Tax=unclassified Streptomyces TaxID=2593676 RepID=UPI0037A4C069
MISQKALGGSTDPSAVRREGPPPGGGELAVVVLAAGRGERMGAGRKVLRQVGGRAMLGHVFDAVEALRPSRIVVVTAGEDDQVTRYAQERRDSSGLALDIAVQESQNGYGHALLAGLGELGGFTGTIVVTCSDAPLLTPPTLRRLITEHEKSQNAMTLLSGWLREAPGYSLVVRSEVGEFEALTLPNSGSPREGDEPREVGAGVYAFDSTALRAAFEHLLSSGDASGEYLVAVAERFTGNGDRIGIATAEDSDDILGANDQGQLARVRAALRDRLNRWWMAAGVEIIDPATTWIDIDVSLEAGAVIHPHTHLRGTTTVQQGASVGPGSDVRDSIVAAGAQVVRSTVVGSTIGARTVVEAYSTLRGSVVGADTSIANSVLEQASLGDGVNVGPYALLRPDTRLDDRAKAGTFVEIKNSHIGEGAKVPHLSYVGDADIGEGSNIGGLTAFANYDGREKYRSIVGRNVRIGGQNGIIAPVTVGDGAYSGGRAVISKDVPPGALVISEGSIKQRNIPGWVQKNRPGSASAVAAAMAQGDIADAPEPVGAQQQVPGVLPEEERPTS